MRCGGGIGGTSNAGYDATRAGALGSMRSLWRGNASMDSCGNARQVKMRVFHDRHLVLRICTIINRCKVVRWIHTLECV